MCYRCAKNKVVAGGGHLKFNFFFENRGIPNSREFLGIPEKSENTNNFV